MKTQKPYYITTEKISVGYDGKPLIEEVEIALRKGEILTLLGPNGAGKSTILKSIARQLSLIAGTVRLDGEDMKSLTGAELSKKMAVVMTKRLRAELMTCEHDALHQLMAHYVLLAELHLPDAGNVA